MDGLYEIFACIKELDLDIYRAYSGEEAVDWLNRTRFDIVLTDIKMPEIDGLKLLDEIIKNWPQCRVIFLTGHNEFEYVYEAIQHKNVSYLLKTEDPEKVVAEVENTIKDIEKGIKIENLIHKAKEQMNMVKDLFQKDYFIHLLHNDSSAEISKQQFEQLSIPLYPDKPVILLLERTDNLSPDISYGDKIQHLNSIRFILNKNLNTHVRSVNIMDDNYRFILFIQPKESIMDDLYEESMASYQKTVSFLKGTLEVVQAICSRSLNASISFVLADYPCRWEEVPQKYYMMNQMLSNRISIGKEMLLIDHGVRLEADDEAAAIGRADEKMIHMLLHQKKMDALELYLEAGEKKKYFKELSELVDPLKNIDGKSNATAVLAYYKITLSLLSYIHRSNLFDKLSVYIEKNKLMQIDSNKSWAEAVDDIFNISDEIFNHQYEEEKSREDNTITYIHRFVESHLNEDLSLIRLAEQVYLNPSYLSRFYKLSTGINLSHYIDSVRIEKAKQLLKSENLKIYKVAKAVGYETPASFTRFFKKIVGISPQEYLDSAKAANKEIAQTI